jgi:hypothetical protein
MSFRNEYLSTPADRRMFVLEAVKGTLAAIGLVTILGSILAIGKHFWG